MNIYIKPLTNGLINGFLFLNRMFEIIKKQNKNERRKEIKNERTRDKNLFKNKINKLSLTRYDKYI